MADIPNLVNPGRVFIYYGSTTPEATADSIINGEADFINFGDSLSIGMLFGGSRAVLAVGASFYGAPNERGAMYLFQDPPFDQYTIRLSGESLGDRFGYALEIGGDCNGDQREDLLVAALLHGSLDQGKTYLYKGISSTIVPALNSYSLVVFLFVLTLILRYFSRR